MLEYSKQFLSELNAQMPERIIKFYDEHAEKFGLDRKKFKEFIEITINTHFQEADQLSIYAKTAELKKLCRTYKNRLISMHKKNSVEYSIMHTKHPYYFIYLKHSILTTGEWERLYGKCSLNEFIKIQDDKFEEWEKQKEYLFIDFPGILNLTPHVYIKYLKLDIAMVVCNIVQSQFNGSFDNYFRRYPNALLNKPIFSPSPVGLAINSVASLLSDEYLITSDGNTRLRTSLLNKPSNPNETYKTWDILSYTMFDAFLSNLNQDFFINHVATIEVSKLARLVWNKPSARHYAKVEECCKNLGKYSHTIHYEGTEIVFNLFDLVSITDAPGQKVVVFHASLPLATAIIKNRMTYVTTNSFNSLQLEMSKILYFTLQKERITTTIQELKNGSQLDKMRLFSNYSYAFFKSVIYFKYKQTTKNIALILESLEEFKKKGIAIKDYWLERDNTITIEYIPLSQDEYDDLSFKPFIYNVLECNKQLLSNFTESDEWDKIDELNESFHKDTSRKIL